MEQGAEVLGGPEFNDREVCGGAGGTWRQNLTFREVCGGAGAVE